MDSLKQDAVNACSISDKKSYQSTPDFPATVMNLNNIIGTTVQKVVSDAAIVQPEFVLAPKILFDHQEQVKRAVNDLKAQMATLS